MIRMGENTLTLQQMEALLAFAAKKLGVSQEQLARTLQSGRVGELGLSEENEKRLSTLLGNRQAVNDLLESPQAKELLRRAAEGQSHGRG